MKKRSTLSKDVLKKIKLITIKTKRLLRGTMAGDSRSALKGTGFEFDQIREYQFGDDVRFIDWKASSRLNNLLVKQYIEERCRTIILAVDVSASGIMGSENSLKRDIFAEVASILTLVTAAGKDRVGLILFTDEIETYIPPARGLNHAHLIMQKLYSHEPTRRTTNVSAPLKKLAQYKQKDAITFLISDFIDTNIDPKLLGHVAQKHELYAIRCLDLNEKKLENFGFIPIEDSETGEQSLLDTRHANGAINSYLTERLQEQSKLFKKKGVRLLEIANNHTFMNDLVRFFKRRMQY